MQRLDAVVALAMIAAVHGAVRRRPGAFGLAAGLAGACKVVPLLAVPVIVAADWTFWRARGRWAALGAWIAAGLALGFAPMVLASPHALADFVRYHGGRGLQVESTWALLLGAGRWIAGTAAPASFAFGSFNLDGAVAGALAEAALPLTVLAIAALAAWTARDASDEGRRVERVARAALAATAVVWLGGKVFSPQYLTWGVPLALAVPGRRAAKTLWLFGAALVLTQTYHRGFYSELAAQRFFGIFTVLARQAVLAALAVLLVRRAPLSRAP